MRLNQKYSLQKLLKGFILASTIAAAGCSNNPASKTIAHAEGDQGLPPALTKNAKNLDTNENSVRDDIEREIYLLNQTLDREKFYPGLYEMQITLAKALSKRTNIAKMETVAINQAISALFEYIDTVNEKMRNDGVKVPPESVVYRRDIYLLYYNIKKAYESEHTTI
jgi:hypothetical protein